jgi:hypothetical protein
MSLLCLLTTSLIWMLMSSGIPLGELNFVHMEPLDFQIGIDWSSMPLSRMGCEASLSSWCHGTCKFFDIQGIDRGVESHGSCDQRFEMAKRCIGVNEDGRHRFLPMCWVFGILQQQPWQEGLPVPLECICNGAPRVQSWDLQGESQRSSLH